MRFRPPRSREPSSVSARRRRPKPANNISWCEQFSTIWMAWRVMAWLVAPAFTPAAAGLTADGIRWAMLCCAILSAGCGRKPGCGRRKRKGPYGRRKNMRNLATLFLGGAVILAAAGCGSSSDGSRPQAASLPDSSASSSALVSPAASATKPNDPADVLSVLSVEHQLDVETQLDGVVVSV